MADDVLREPLTVTEGVSIVELPLIVKSADPTGRSFAGIASTPDIDTHGHSIDPLSVTFTNPAPLLLQHDQRTPIGTVTFGAPTKDGVPFTAEIPAIAEAGEVKLATDRAAHLLKYGLIRKVSVGLQMLAFEPLKDGLMRITKAVFHELSLVTVPANRHAAITVVKSADPAPKDRPMHLTTAQQITDLESRRATVFAQMTAILDDDHMDDAKQKEYDGLEAECQTLDAKLPRLKAFEKRLASEATAVDSPILAPRSAAVIRKRAAELAPGTGFVRYCKAIAAGQGDTYKAIGFAKDWWRDSSPEVELLLRAASSPATVANIPFAGPLA